MINTKASTWDRRTTALPYLRLIAAAAQALHRAVPVVLVAVHPVQVQAHRAVAAQAQAALQVVHQVTLRLAAPQVIHRVRQAVQVTQQAQTVRVSVYSLGQSLHLEREHGFCKHLDALADVLSQPALDRMTDKRPVILVVLKPNLIGHDVRTPEGRKL